LLRSDCLEPNGENASDGELLVAMEAAPNKRSYRRLAAVRALLRGWPRAEVAQVFGRSERMVRLWILAFNSGGIDALASKPRPGRPRKVKLERVRDLLVPVLEEPGKAGQRHWTGVKLLRRDEYRLLPVFFGSIGRDHSSRAGQMPSPFHR